MNRSDIKQYAPVIYSALKAHDQDHCNVILGNLSDPAFDFVCKCVNRVVHQPQSLKLSDQKLKDLRKVLKGEEKTLVYLAKKKASRDKKRKLVSTQSGSGIGIALATVLPLLITSIKSLINRKKK